MEPQTVDEPHIPSDASDFLALSEELLRKHKEHYEQKTNTSFAYCDIAQIADSLKADGKMDDDLVTFLKNQNNLLQTMNVKQTYNCLQFTKRERPIADIDLEHRQISVFLDHFLSSKQMAPHIIEELQSNEGFYKRMYIRLQLLMSNWNDKNLESSLKCNCQLTWNLQDEYIWLTVIRMQLHVDELFGHKRSSKGRPRVPEQVLGIYKQHLNNKKKETISKKYQVYNFVKKMTVEDFTKLKGCLKAAKDHEWTKRMTEILDGLSNSL